MPEQPNPCETHPIEEEDFKRSVLRASIAKNACRFILPGSDQAELPSTLIAALGVDVARSAIVNECADRIASGECTRYQLSSTGEGICISPIEVLPEPTKPS